MKLISRVLVLMDLSEMDETIMGYVNSIVERTPVEEIHFLNVIRSFQLPEEIRKEFPDLEHKALEERKAKLTSFVEKNYKFPEKVKPNILVESGSSLRTVIRLAKELDLSSVFVGRKKNKDEGVLPQRLARRLSCNLVILPQDSHDFFEEPDVNRILVPIDFSDNAKIALKEAISLGEYAAKETSVFAQHVITVPSGYHYTGKSYKEFAEIMVKNAEKTFEKYVKDLDTTGVELKPVFSINDDDKVNTIAKASRDLNANMIFFASKGRSGATAYFLGSTAEKLIKIDSKCPLIVVRKKNEFKSILDSLKEI